MSVEITIPDVGESIAEGILVEWLVEDGAIVEAEQPLFELETDKVTLTVTAEQGGRVRIEVPADSTVQIGQVVGLLEGEGEVQVEVAANGEDPDGLEITSEEEDDADDLTDALEPDQLKLVEARVFEPTDLDSLSPAVRRLVVEHQLDPSQIVGTGKDGRILKADVLAYRRTMAASPSEPEAAAEPTTGPAEAPDASPGLSAQARTTDTQPSIDVGDLLQVAAAEAGPAPSSLPPTAGDSRQTRVRMSSLRRRIAERLVQAQRDAAILTTFNEVDMSAVFELRGRYQATFEQRYGVRLGVMSFFVKAAVDALKTVPQVNVVMDGDDLVTNHFYDIGVAVSTDRGLMAPVVRRADELGFAELELRIADLARRAQDRKLELSELLGGVFTVSNGGVFGSLMSTPILNPPQSAILGMHGIKKRPVVVDDEIVIRPMMYLALSYDHRVIDGREAVTFLRRVVDCIEHPERMLLEV